MLTGSRQRTHSPVASVSISALTRMPSCSPSSLTSISSGVPSCTVAAPRPVLLGRGHVEGALAHLTGTVDEVAHVEIERRGCSRHEGSILRA